MGLLRDRLKHEYSATLLRQLEQVFLRGNPRAVVPLDGAERTLRAKREGLSRGGMQLLRSVDVRYVGQSYELTMSLAEGQVRRAAIEELADGFHDEHERAYGFKAS